MTTQQQPNDDAGSDRPDVGQDPMHPHPQDERPPDADDDRGGDDEADPEAASPGIAATRPMSAPGEVPEPNEPG
jgi:hypothetical protein